MEQNKECWGRILKVVYDKDDTCGVLELSFLPGAIKFRLTQIWFLIYITSNFSQTIQKINLSC